jgi:PPM family protein phosphatase
MRRLSHTDLPVVALTHPGMKGKNNEDCFGVSSYSLDPLGSWPVMLAVLCDGIGGHRAGEVAAEIAVDRISREVGKSNAANPPVILQSAIQAASEDIYVRAMTSPQQNGMGATCACVWIIGDKLFTATVGDSRLYLLRGDAIRQLSTDHTWIQEALTKGVLKPDQISGHPNQHVIRRYLGSQVAPEVDLRLRLRDDEDDAQAEANQGFQLLPGDLVLLTSDGLTDLVNDAEIQDSYRKITKTDKSSLEDAGHRLIDLANQRGGHDNITLVAVSYPVLKPESAPRFLRWVGHNWYWGVGGCAGLSLALLLALGLAGGWGWFNRTSGPISTPTLISTLESVPATAVPTAIPQPDGLESDREPSFLTPTPTAAVLLPDDNGPTLTPWPTNTVVK